MNNNKQTAVEWLVEQNDQSNTHHTIRIPSEYVEKAKEMENRQQDTFAIEFAEWIINQDWDETELNFPNNSKSTKELLQLWKEQKPKIVYYE